MLLTFPIHSCVEQKSLVMSNLKGMILLGVFLNLNSIQYYDIGRSLFGGGGGGQLKKSLKKSKSISGILGWVLTFFDPKF